ncbi:tyrosine-protein kinase JAK3 isoform X1 [Pleurodeles waltl]|uniref:tyrosine-protein kinase JAK3 isoform X1 n=1 Tax=Pleurodeles waltl TaxID=8319 RepID=UPI0037096AB5
MVPVGEDRPLLGVARSCSLSSCEQGGLQVFLYHHHEPLTSAADSVLTFTFGAYAAEELCLAAAKASGILPVYHTLFALASHDLATWYPPNHIFTVDEATCQVVKYRIRFFFPNWFGLGNPKSMRRGLRRGEGSAVLDCAVIDYLFAQCRSDFISRGREGQISLEMQEEFLALALLDMLCIAKESRKTPQEILDCISYKACIPEDFRRQIQQLHILTRRRIRRTFRRSLRRIGACSTPSSCLKLKYLIDLERMEKTMSQETFRVRSIMGAQGGRDVAETLIRVSGETGISWSCGETEKGQLFCDFPEVVDISIKQDSCENAPAESRVVTITKRDNRILDAEFPSLEKALSFVALVDGYYRLTTDSHHYFCKGLAPPSLLWNIRNQCHGPITSEFAVHKLKKTSDSHTGAYILRCSLQDFEQFILTVCVETPLGTDYKDCLITRTERGYSFAGVDRHFTSMKNLLEYYQSCSLQAGGATIQLRCRCPPRPKEKSNLLIARGSCPQMLASPDAQRRNLTQMSFHNIHPKDITWGESLGQGSFTKIFRGVKRDVVDADEVHRNDVLLKVLDSAHKGFNESFLEAASLMSQISHKHLLLLYGVCVGKDSIMVQEYVKHGALDVYLKKHKASGKVTTSWKLEVVKQLAYALNFLEDKNIVHGNVCAKNVLLAREGDASSGSAPFIKLSDPGVSISALTQEVLVERIPWVAPECLEDPGKVALESDKWSFGITVWAIFSGGGTPLSALDPLAKLQFFQKQLQLPAPKWIELATLITQCTNYRPELRPSFRAIIRDLNSLITSDYELLADLPPRDQQAKDSLWPYASLVGYEDPTLFEERHLKYISMLGKGNFGSVELCRYDPLEDNTGNLVAVKKLQHNTAEHLRSFQRESEILKALSNDFIVKYKGVCYGAGRKNLRLVMEYLPNGSLREYLQNNREQLNSWNLLLFASQICKGMEYLGTQRYVHRDLAIRNILVQSDNHVKIGDFGLAKILPQDKEYYVVRERGESPIFWYAPESLADSVFSRESDVWSFGVLLYELFTYAEKSKNPPAVFLHMMGPEKQLQLVSNLLELLRDGRRLPAPPDCPSEVYSLMQSCWDSRPKERPTFSDLGFSVDTLKHRNVGG